MPYISSVERIGMEGGLQQRLQKRMEQAMSTLQSSSDKERDYHAYQARQNFIREQRTIQMELETALTEKNAALAEIERLKALLDQKGTRRWQHDRCRAWTSEIAIDKLMGHLGSHAKLRYVR